MKITIDKAVLKRVLNAILYAVPQTASQAKEQLESLLVLRGALAQPQPEPAWWPAVENILDEYGLQAIDFVADFKAALAQPQQEPFGHVTVRRLSRRWPHPDRYQFFPSGEHPYLDNVDECHALYTSPTASTATSEDVLVPLGILEAAEISLGSFCSDHGWSADDMQTMDNLSAYIAKHKAAHRIK